MKYEIYIYEEAKTASFYKKAIAEYEKRLHRYCKISCRFIKKQKEWEKLCKAVKKGIFLFPGSHSISSEEFSTRIGNWEMDGQGKVCFFISPPGQTHTDTAEQLHLSAFTMDTAMTAMILYEQIYRGYRILNNHPYHK